MNRLTGLFVPPFLLFLGSIVFAQTPRDTVVEVSATVQEAPPQISLSWLPTVYPITLQKVFRKQTGAGAWTEVANVSSGISTYIDPSVTVGVSYEYFVVRIFASGGPGSASGYVNAGIKLPLKDSRGRVLLIVDDTVAAGLAAELSVFVQDLIGDGWSVTRQDVSRNGTPAAIKATIQVLYNADPVNTKSVILFGHVPVPYSGDLNPDGHPDHRGAWPADGYYADMDGIWTDVTVNDPGASRSENRNIPGDGKFDQSAVPSDLELEVGRIDLSNLPSASPTPDESTLLRQYLNRDHAFRFQTGSFANVPRRGLIADNLGYFNGEAFAASGWRNFTSFFGSQPGAIIQASWFPALQNDRYLCAYGCGFGSYESAYGVGTTGSFAVTPCLAVFNMLFGSYFGDWDVANSFLRAPLAGRADSLGLVNVWAGRPHWQMHHMAMGETVGYAARTTQNNLGFSTGGYVANLAPRGVHIALMGDPTLRLHPVLPPSNLVVDSNSGIPSLTWAASLDTAIEGYSILRANTPDGPFDSVSGSVIPATSFVDRSGIPGQSYHYQVRAVKLETSASGTYRNSSQAVFGAGSFSGPVAREIQITSNGHPIPSGAIIASASAGTDFGTAEAAVQTVNRTFTITNAGTGSLSLTGSSLVQISGSGAAAFLVVTQPPNVVSSSGSVQFQIRFAPPSTGVWSATVSIANDDPDEGNYEFAITGTGVPQSPEINVTPTSTSATLAPNGAASLPITVTNTGAGALHYTVTTSQADYSFRDSSSFGGPQYDWIDISATGTEITGFDNPDDAMSGVIPIGFNFPFYGTTFSSLRVCTNAFISFGAAIPLFFGTSLPSIEAPGNIIAAFWNDLILDANSHIYTQQVGDLFVVEFLDIPRYGVSTERVTCEIVLKQTGEIFMQYKQVPAGFSEYTVGIQDALRSLGKEIAYHTAYVSPQFAIRIAPPGYDAWLAPDPALPQNLAGGSVTTPSVRTLNANVSSAGLPSGHYFSLLNIQSDDSDEGSLSVPVQLSVSGPEIVVMGNGLSVASGDATPSLTDRTDFGRAGIGGGFVSRTFVIHNTGSDPLAVGSVSVAGSGFSISTQPSSPVPAASSSTFVVTFAPSLAGNAAGTVSFTTNDADETNYSFAVAGLGLSPVESWRLENFGTILDAGNAADLSDPDRDGLRNLMEYALSLNPNVPNGAGAVSVRANPNGYLEIQFSRSAAHSDIGYIVQASSNFVTWTPIATSTGGAATVASGAHSAAESGNGTIKLVTVEDSQAMSVSSPRFLRLKIVRNSP